MDYAMFDGSPSGQASWEITPSALPMPVPRHCSHGWAPLRRQERNLWTWPTRERIQPADSSQRNRSEDHPPQLDHHHGLYATGHAAPSGPKRAVARVIWQPSRHSSSRRKRTPHVAQHGADHRDWYRLPLAAAATDGGGYDDAEEYLWRTQAGSVRQSANQTDELLFSLRLAMATCSTS